MAYGIEIVLGWNLNDFCKLFNFPYPDDPENDWNKWEDWEDKVADIMESELKYAQLEGLKRHGVILKFIKTDDLLPDWYIGILTPYGERMFSPARMEVFFDPDELGEEFPDDVLVGVALAKRYFPVYLDWKENGYAPNFCISDSKLTMVETFKQLVGDDRFKTAKLYVKERWY